MTAAPTDEETRTPTALTIAGSDSGGGAGIQADLKTFSALGVFGCSVITALTAQNTKEVRGIYEVTPKFIRLQMDTVFDDIAVHAVKIGMLGAAPVIEAVRKGLDRHKPAWTVLDPVMVSKGGAPLLPEDAVDALKSVLVPAADVITPNLPEGAVLTGLDVPETPEDMVAMAEAILKLGPKAALLKGGHLGAGDSPDLLMSEAGHVWLPGRRYETKNTHGTGCTLSSAIAAELAKNHGLDEAIKSAKAYISNAISAADQLHIGEGHGPVHHFHGLWVG